MLIQFSVRYWLKPTFVAFYKSHKQVSSYFGVVYKTSPNIKLKLEVFCEDISRTVLWDPEVFLFLFYYFNSLQYRDVMNGFTYILLSVWFAWCQVFISGKLTHACYICWCSIVEVVVGMLCVPSLWLLLRCVRIVLIRILDFSISRRRSFSSLSASILFVCSS